MTTPDPGQQQQEGGNKPQDGGTQSGSQQQSGQGGGQQQDDLKTPKFSQADVNRIEANVRREYQEKAARDKELIEKGKEYQTLLAESQPLSERVQTLSAESAQKDTTIADKDLTIRRLQLAWEAGLPPAIGRRVQGKAEDEIRADIDALKQELPQLSAGQQQQHGSGVRPNPQQGVPSSGDTNRTGSAEAGRDLWNKRHGKKTDAAV